MSKCVIRLTTTIHNRKKLLVNEYEYMLNKIRVRKRDRKHVHYWVCTKKCGATIRTVLKNDRYVKDKSCVLMEHKHGYGERKKRTAPKKTTSP